MGNGRPMTMAEIVESEGFTPTNESALMRAVDAAFRKAVGDVFDRMVKDLEHAQLPVVRSDMTKRLDVVRTVHAEMSQRVADLEA